MIRLSLCLVLLQLLLWTPSPAAAEVQVLLGGDLVQRLGIRTLVLTPVRHSEVTEGFAKVLDPGPLAQLESDLEAAQAAARASAAEARRLHAVRRVQGAATKDVEAADSQAAQDEAHLLLLRRRVELEWGPGVARLSQAQRTRLINGLAAGKLALVHIDTPSNEGQQGARTADIDVGSSSARAVILGPARAAEPRLQSSGLIGLVSGPQAILLSNGLTQSAHIHQAGSASGVRLPRAAVVRLGGADWAYVDLGRGRFARRPVTDPKPDGDGLFVERGFAPGEKVVVSGVAALLTADTAGAAG